MGTMYFSIFGSLSPMTKPRFRIIPECHADTALARFFVPNVKQEDHANGSSNVASEMKRAGFSEVILIGLIDNDKLKHTPRYFDDFIEIERGQCVSFRQKEDVRVEHYLIVLERAIETFLLYNAAQVGINVADFGFSEVQKEFQKNLKSQQIEDSENYQSLLKALRDQQAPDFIKIEAFLNQFL